MLSDDVAHVLRWHGIWGVTGTKVKVENDHFDPWTKNQYPQIESQIPKWHLILSSQIKKMKNPILPINQMLQCLLTVRDLTDNKYP